MKDAIEEEIKIGEPYGWRTNSNGFTYVTLGIVDNITEKRVTIHIKEKKVKLYQNQFKEVDVKNLKISVRPDLIFPLPKKFKEKWAEKL